MTKRLIEFWHRSKEEAWETTSGMWKSIVTNYQYDLVAALESEDTANLEVLMESGGRFTYGVGDVNDTDRDGRLIYLLAQKVGACRTYNPESPNLTTVDDLRKAVEAKLGIRLSAPNCFGFNNQEGIQNRFLLSCAGAHTMLLRLGHRPLNVLEIGAGLGFMGHICWQWQRPYTVIDLPTVAVMSAYFLSKLCGEEKIWLYGEQASTNPFARFYPCSQYVQAGWGYQVVYNADSLVEMNEATIRAYTGFIANRLLDDGFFLSINHESNSNTVQECSEGLMLRSRSGWMLRPGYMEEIYTKASQS